MTREEVIQAFNAIRVWQSGDRRAVHKPLLVLLALSRVNGSAAASMDWNDAEPLLKVLLEEFGPDGSSNTRHYPFWHLQTDGLWQLEGPAAILNRPAGAPPTLTELRQNHVRGGFMTPIYAALAADPEIVATVAQRIVEAHFPESIRGDVLDAVPNGISMCALHHKVFDLGAFKILPETYQMVFSQHLNGSEATSQRMLAYHEAGLIQPQATEYLPHPANLAWHAIQVFKSPARA